MELSFNEVFKRSNKNLIPVICKKGVITGINASANSVDVYLVDNPQTVIKSVPVSSAIVIASTLVGKRCRVDIFDETNYQDMVVAYTY